MEATAHEIGPITEKLVVRSAALLIAPLKRRAANTALGHPPWSAKWAFQGKVWSVEGVCF